MTGNEKKWFAVDVWTNPQTVEAVEHALSEAGADGTEYSTLGKKEILDTVVVIGYFEVEPTLETIAAEIKKALSIYDLPFDLIKEFAVRPVENQDWNAVWKQHWKPTETNRFIVAPSWSATEASDKIAIFIEPGMAFGTGTHETTRLCVKAIEANYQPDESFFDVGTGTGVLAIAVAKLSENAEIVGCDTDFDSVKIAAENAAINGVESKIKFYDGSINEGTAQFDFVAANLTADVIIPHLPLLIEKSRRVLLLSGILGEQKELVETELRRLISAKPQIEISGEWVSLLIEK